MSENIFELAIRKKIRFPSARGDLTAEDLFDLPLESKNAFDLDNVAKAVNTKLRAVTEDSFVATRVNPEKGRLELALSIVKAVIEEKLTEAEERKQASRKSMARVKILEALAEKETDELKTLSAEELRKKLAEL